MHPLDRKSAISGQITSYSFHLTSNKNESSFLLYHVEVGRADPCHGETFPNGHIYFASSQSMEDSSKSDWCAELVETQLRSIHEYWFDTINMAASSLPPQPPSNQSWPSATTFNPQSAEGQTAPSCPSGTEPAIAAPPLHCPANA
jgi:hypothetical protein